MSDSLFVKVGSTMEALDLGTGTAPEYVERIEALEAEQDTQDTAIAAAQATADAAQATADAAQAAADAAQATADAAQATADAALPKSGGTVTGIIVQSGNYEGLIRQASDSQVLSFWGATDWHRGAFLDLYGADRDTDYAGGFVLGAHGFEENYVALRGWTDGTLKWNENKVLTLVASWHDGDSWYRKYSDGWIEQGGYVRSYTGNVNLYLPYKNTSYCILTGPYGSMQGDWVAVVISDQTTTGFSAGWHGSDYYPGGVFWRTCGY